MQASKGVVKRGIETMTPSVVSQQAHQFVLHSSCDIRQKDQPEETCTTDTRSDQPNLYFGAMIEVEHRQIRTPSGYIFDAFRSDLPEGDGTFESKSNTASELHAQDKLCLDCFLSVDHG